MLVRHFFFFFFGLFFWSSLFFLGVYWGKNTCIMCGFIRLLVYFICYVVLV
ncbi:Uncharacterised protein [Segatella copri]|nr:Uncharacterised protein [Segatella copri]